MKGNKLTVFISALTLILVFAVMCSFQLNKDEKAVLTTFGKPQVVKEPGLYFRWPWPIQKLVRLDIRKQLYEDMARETVTKDNINLIVKLVVTWSIDKENPLEFYKKVGENKEDADKQLETLIKSTQQVVIRSYSQTDFFSRPASVIKNKEGKVIGEKPARQSRLGEIENSLLKNLNDVTSKKYGIIVHNVAFVRNSLHEKNSVSVLARMKQEQSKRAVEIRSRAGKEAQLKRNSADKTRAATLAEAEAYAKEKRDEVQAAATRLFAEYENDQEFVAFLRKLDAIKEIMKTQTTMFFTSDVPPFDLFKESKKAPLKPTPSKDNK